MHKAAVLAILTTFALLTPLTAQESVWWQGTFVRESTHFDCSVNDTSITYGAKTVQPWETNCQITQEVPIRDMDGILLDLACTYPGGPDGVFKRRDLLLKLDDQTVFQYPRGERMRRCTSDGGFIAPKCPWTERLWRAHGSEYGAFQQIRFLDNSTSEGRLILKQFKGNKVSWASVGEFGCSNGVPICTVEFRGVVNPEPYRFPYEIVGEGEGDYIVIPGFGQKVYSSENTVLTDMYPYTGLKAIIFDENAPAKGKVLTPANVYKYTACRTDEAVTR